VCPLLSSPASCQLYIYMQHTMLHVYLHRESQPPFDGLYEDGGLYEDMHSLHQDQDDASHVRWCIRIRIWELVHMRAFGLERSIKSIKSL